MRVSGSADREWLGAGALAGDLQSTVDCRASHGWCLFSVCIAGLQGNALILNNSAIAELNAGNSAQALQLARQAAALTPEDPQVMDTMGWVLLQAGGDKAEALAWLTRAVETMPGNLEIRWHYAAGLAANGRNADARNIIGGVREFANAEQRARIDELLASL